MSSKLDKLRARYKEMRFLRSTVAILSYAYYVRGEAIISDVRWQAMADDLHALHMEYPNYSDDYDEYWEDWEPSTGYTLINIPGLEHECNKLFGLP